MIERSRDIWSGWRLELGMAEKLDQLDREIDECTQLMEETSPLDWQRINMLTNKRRRAAEKILRHLFTYKSYEAVMNCGKVKKLKAIAERANIDFHRFVKDYYDIDDEM